MAIQEQDPFEAAPSNRKAVLGLIIIALVIIGLILFMVFSDANEGRNTNTNSNTNANTNTQSVRGVNTSTLNSNVNANPVSEQPGVKTFEITASNFRFSETRLNVNRGDTVKILFKNLEGTQYWVIDAFNAKTDRLTKGESASVEFIANKSGEFEFYCSVGDHRELGMTGTLIVK